MLLSYAVTVRTGRVVGEMAVVVLAVGLVASAVYLRNGAERAVPLGGASAPAPVLPSLLTSFCDPTCGPFGLVALEVREDCVPPRTTKAADMTGRTDDALLLMERALVSRDPLELAPAGFLSAYERAGASTSSAE